MRAPRLYVPRQRPQWLPRPYAPRGAVGHRLGVLALAESLELEVWTEAGRTWAFVAIAGRVVAVLEGARA